MGIKTLIERLNQYSQSLIAYKLGADFADACMDAATALSRQKTKSCGPSWTGKIKWSNWHSGLCRKREPR